MDRHAFDLGKKRTVEMLQEAASLDISFEKPEHATLKITNKTGHKLPTGYEEGRRMWINAVFLDSSGKVLKEIGKYAEKDDTILGEPVRAPTLLDPEKTRVYEILFGISENRAKKYNVKPGKSFHTVLNDIIVKDNRIPPEGFSNAAYTERLSQPVGANYTDGQYWDQFEMALPEGCKKLIVSLMYESVSWEYLKFLVEEDKTDDWGKRLYDAWTKTGKGQPIVVAKIENVIR
jgi:hypothetical protein